MLLIALCFHLHLKYYAESGHSNDMRNPELCLPCSPQSAISSSRYRIKSSRLAPDPIPPPLNYRVAKLPGRLSHELSTPRFEPLRLMVVVGGVFWRWRGRWRGKSLCLEIFQEYQSQHTTARNLFFPGFTMPHKHKRDKSKSSHE